MAADGTLTSRSLPATHCLDVSGLMDEPRTTPPMRAPTASHAKVRAHTTAPRAVGAKWVEAAQTELGMLSAAMADEMSARITAGFASGSNSAIGTAETAFMLAIADDEQTTDEDDREDLPKLMVMAVPAARPASPVLGQTDPTGPVTPRRPHRGVDAEAVRAVLAQPTAALLSVPDSVESPRIELAPAKPRAKSFTPPRGARPRSFVGQLGVPVVPPATSTAPMSQLHRMVVTHRSRTRALNMTAAILSGLAAAMAVMAVVVSV